MNSTYLILDVITIFFPLVLSFDKKVNFVKSWKYVLLAILVIGIPFIIWDIIFTKIGIWSFNEDYLLGITIGNLPLEEVLFFVVVPFACTFIYVCLKAYFNKIRLIGFNRIFYTLLVGYGIAILIFGWGKFYSVTVAVLAFITIYLLQKHKKSLRYLPLAFVVALIPFFIVNGVLTGTGLEAPIVRYDDFENSTIRWFTIPAEDILYAWILIAGNIAVFQYLSEKNTKKPKKRK
ncbi:lycopene cyclase domain-containing protein [Crocinitomix sp.]|nr:lycopene cyclase domain-containing protein [Crocinitomix sp.]